jgi:hypothetical protein
VQRPSALTPRQQSCVLEDRFAEVARVGREAEILVQHDVVGGGRFSDLNRLPPQREGLPRARLAEQQQAADAADLLERHDARVRELEEVKLREPCVLNQWEDALRWDPATVPCNVIVEPAQGRRKTLAARPAVRRSPAAVGELARQRGELREPGLCAGVEFGGRAPGEQREALVEVAIGHTLKEPAGAAATTAREGIRWRSFGGGG